MAVKAYRESDLMKEAVTYEQELGLSQMTTREGYPLVYSSDQKE